jgi:hypothetical protein
VEKVRWPNRTAAEFVADIHRWKQDIGRRRTRKPLSVYHCRTCDGWHVGTTPDLNRNYRRILEREPTLLLELGKRALAQMFSESHGPTALDRRRAITIRGRHPIPTPENRPTLKP